jgi:paired amphipathic helix protein Sin3a
MPPGHNGNASNHQGPSRDPAAGNESTLLPSQVPQGPPGPPRHPSMATNNAPPGRVNFPPPVAGQPGIKRDGFIPGPGFPPSQFGRGPPPPAGHPRPQNAGPPTAAPPQAPRSAMPPQGQSYPPNAPRSGTQPPSGNSGLPPQGTQQQPHQGPPRPGMRPGPPPQDQRRIPGPPMHAMNRPPHQQGQPGSQGPPPPGGHPVNRPPFRPGPPAAAGMMPPQQGGGGMRELRVEDALVYLDDVKREFGDRPKIYNEFLEIMKNFKSQEVDTPGVIDRVSRLFRGYNNLILGFNKFLPDGYKISLQDLERREAELQRQAQQQQQGGPGYYQGQSGPRPPPPVPAPSHMMQSHPPRREGPPPQPPHMQSHGRPPAPSAQAPQQGYPTVKRPTGGQGPPQQQLPTDRGVGNPKSPVINIPPPLQQMAPRQGPPPQQAHRGPPPASQPPQPVQAPPQQQPQHQAVEFDHAISYVTNIKKRFSDDPSTYHQFLEILHTYQKEQRGIKEVLEQVASLFADHPDLLKEFTFFLPDAVQEQAKERLHRAAAESESRQALAAQQQQQGYAGRQVPSGWHSGPRGLDPNRSQQMRRMAQPKFIDMTGQQAEVENVDSTPPPRPSPPSRKRPFSPVSGGTGQPTAQPETFVYNSAVERQFFDAAKEALTTYSRDGGQAWAEFLKCLDMYAQELLSKTEMLSFVEQLLGKRSAELFEEFKRILGAAGSPTGSTPSMEDSWYSVPLSDIDFFRCRQCTPSYRALPRDYPAPPCSERSEEEAKVLNNIWVSLPKGSEESYTFRHMRRNHYEEMLFRCEDERFEIDQVIDSNAATLRRLEPIAEEIAQLAQEEEMQSEFSSSKAGECGMGGLRFQYTFDPTILGVIHRNAIARLYGDAGQEMLELIVKNPTAAVPVVVSRLQQKDREWKVAREKLNRHWKELAEANYYKSLDHRSLTWRTIDKRATSTRTLIAEIKDRAAHCGKEGEAAIAARREKAKEEHGTFYDVTMGNDLCDDLDLPALPKPHDTLFTPHLSLLYENNSWAQQDAYRILSFALERGAISPHDKERCHRLWREFLGPWFGLTLNWMQRPAVSYQESIGIAYDGMGESSAVVSSTAEESAMTVSGMEDEDDSVSVDDHDLGKNVVTEELRERGTRSNSSGLMDYHPLPAGAMVSTVYGEGRIVRFRRSDKKYVVAMPFGQAYLRPNAVLCTILSAPKDPYTNQLRCDDTTTLERKDDVLAIGTQSLYLFFRLHQILIRRLNIAKRTAYEVTKDETLQTLIEQMHALPGEDVGRKRYDAYLSLVYSLVDGGGQQSHHAAAEGGRYEDRVRCLLGNGAYELATMDKLLSHILKNLQNMANDETMHNLVQLFRRHHDQGSFKPEAFRQEAAHYSDGENMIAFQRCNMHEEDKAVIHMEFLGVIDGGGDRLDEADEVPDTSVEPATNPKRPKRQRE